MNEFIILEKQVLFFLLQDVKYISSVKLKGISHKFFEVYEHQVLFSLTHKALEKYGGILTSEMLQGLSIDEEIKQRINLTFLDIKQLKPESNFDYYIEELIKAYKEREVRKALLSSVNLLQKTEVNRAIEVVTQKIAPLMNIGESDLTEGALADSADARLAQYYRVKQTPKILQGIFTGFPTFDRLTNGMREGQLWIIQGPTSQGKSVLLVSIAFNAWKAGHNVLFVSAELSKSELEGRFDSLHSGLYYSNIYRGSLREEEEAVYKNILEDQKSAKNIFYILDAPNCPISLITSRIDELASIFPFELVVVDYLLLIEPTDQGKSKTEAVGNAALELRKQIARKRRIPVLSANQKTMEGVKSSKNRVETGAWSRAVNQHADVVIDIAVRDTDEAALSEICDVDAVVVKNRVGAKGACVLDAVFSRMIMREKTI